jgi:TonB-dependent Receptor Plug Domain
MTARGVLAALLIGMTAGVLHAQNPTQPRASNRCIPRDSVRDRGADTTRAVCQAQVLPGVSTIARSTEQEMFETRPSVGAIALGATSISAVPSVGEPDVLRVVQLLPGVAARNDFNNGLNVRGGESDQNLILLDGYPIYNPFHLGGLFSTFMDATVGGIELLTAAFPARYGGRLSSVLDVHSAEDAVPGTHASMDVSALATSARVAGHIGDARGTWSVAARRTYADATTSIFTDNIFPYHFRDVHAHATYALPRGFRVGATAYTGRDVLDANLQDFVADSATSNASNGRWAFNWGNTLFGATVAKDLGAFTTLEQRFVSTRFSTTLDVGNGSIRQQNSVDELSATGSVRRHGLSHDASAGYELTTDRVAYSSGAPQTGTTDFDNVQRPVSAALWVDDTWRLSSRWIVQGGLRGEELSTRQYYSLSPRLSVKYFVTPDLALTAASGRETQWMYSLEGDGPLHYFDIWIASDSITPVATAWHWVGGVERRVSNAGSVRIEAYLKRYDRVPDVNPSENPGVQGDEIVPVQGESYGADLFARWKHGPLDGWLAYSYGLSSRWLGDARWAPGHDRRHEVNAVGTWTISKYQLGAHFGFGTGTPYTPIVGGLARRQYDPSLDHWGTGNPEIEIESIGGPRNGARFPATHRLDVNASREFRRGSMTFAPYVSIVNAYNAHNVFVYLYRYSHDPPERQALSQFPILPSLGARIAF